VNPLNRLSRLADGNVDLMAVEGKERWYRGSGVLGYQTSPPPNRDPCLNLVMGYGMTRSAVAGISLCA